MDPAPFNREKLVEVLHRRHEEQKAKEKRPYAQASPAGATDSLDDQEQLETDLDAILYGKVPRAYGEMPKVLGLYDRICPGSPEFDRAMRLKRAHLRSHRR